MHFSSGSISLLTLAIFLCIESGIAVPVVQKSSAKAPKTVAQQQKSANRNAAAGISQIKASDLKSSNYRKTALDSNPKGSYIKQAGGSSVAWDPKGKGDAGKHWHFRTAQPYHV